MYFQNALTTLCNYANSGPSGLEQSIIIAGWMITVSWMIARKSGEVLIRRALYTNLPKRHPQKCSEKRFRLEDL